MKSPLSHRNRRPAWVITAACFALVLAVPVRAAAQEDGPLGTHPTLRRPELVLQTDHQLGARRLASSHDGSLLVTAGTLADGGVKVWDVAKGSVVRDLAIPHREIGALAVFADSLVAVAQSGVVYLLELTTGARVDTIASPLLRSPLVVAFDPAGGRLMVGTRNGDLVEWDHVRRTLRPLVRDSLADWSSVTFDPASTRLAAVDEKTGRVSVFAASTGRRLAAFAHDRRVPGRGPEGNPGGSVRPYRGLVAAFSAGSTVISARVDSARLRVTVADAATGAVLHLHEAGLEASGPVALSADGSLMAVGQPGAIRLWEVPSWRELTPLAETPVAPRAAVFDARVLAFAAGGLRLAASAGLPTMVQIPSLVVWELEGRRRFALTAEPPALLSGIGFTGDSRRLFTGGDAIRFWDFEDGYQPYTLGGAFKEMVQVAIRPDGGRMLAALTPAAAEWGDSAFVVTWDAKTDLDPQVIGMLGSLGGELAVSAGWQWVAVAARIERPDSMELYLYEIDTKRRVDLPGYTRGGYAEELALSPDGRWAAFEWSSFSPNRGVKLFSTSPLQEVALGGVSTGVSELDFSGDGRWLVAVRSSTLIAWDLNGGLTQRRYPVQAMSFAVRAGTDEVLFSQPEGGLGVLRLGTGEVRRIGPSAHETEVDDLAISPDGRWAAVLTDDGVVQLWDLSDGAFAATLVALAMYGGLPAFEWLVVNPDGLFDGSPLAAERVSWRVENSNATVPLDALFSDFFFPGLLERIASGPRPRAERDLISELQLPGLRQMVRARLAWLAQSEDTPVLCLSEAAVPAGRAVGPQPLASDEALRPPLLQRLEATPEDSSCPYRVELSDADSTLLRTTRAPDAVPTETRLPLTTTRTATLHVLTIAIDAYDPERTGLSPLPGSITGARALESYFRRMDGRPTSPFATVRVWDGLHDARATRDSILGRLSELIESAGEDDVVLLYLAGHGEVPLGSEMFYFEPFDVVRRDLASLRRSAISSLHLAHALRKLPARRVILLLDACQSGGVVDALEKIADARLLSGGGAEPVGIYVVAATTPLQVALQRAAGGGGQAPGNGPLVATLLQGLGSAGTGGGPVTVRGLVRDLAANLPAAAERAGIRYTPLPVMRGADFPLSDGVP